MDKVKVSVIIPVYNVEECLEECLNSVINQTLKDIEIICVNDGSPDNSLNILEKYAQIDNRITVISQENQGLSGARNTGLKAAKADYVYFLDSDDYISNDYVEALYNTAVETNADIVFNDNIISFDDDDRTKTKQVIKNKFPDGLYTVDSDFIKKRYTNPTAWSKLYKKSVIIDNNITFPIGLISEDAYFYYALMPFVKTAAQINKGNYYYRERQGSLTHQAVKKYRFHSIKIFELIYTFYKQNNLLKDYGLPYRLIAYRSTQVGEYSSYRREVMKMISNLNLDIKKMKEDEKLKLLLISPNIAMYRINKFIYSVIR